MEGIGYQLSPVYKIQLNDFILLLKFQYVSVYGSVYAIADISYCAAYAVGPIIAGHIVEEMGFTALNICVAVLSLAYAPALYYLRGFNTYQNYDEDADVGGGGTIRYTKIDNFIFESSFQYNDMDMIPIKMLIHI